MSEQIEMLLGVLLFIPIVWFSAGLLAYLVFRSIAKEHGGKAHVWSVIQGGIPSLIVVMLNPMLYINADKKEQPENH